jgi:AcrR family transcriptional regulator
MKEKKAKSVSSKVVRHDLEERVRRSKETVLKATAELLSETGFSGVSVDEVARRSGVAKTTIYRHWPTRSALLLETCSRLGQQPEVPDTGSVKGDLTTLASGIASGLQSARWPSVLPSIIDAAERDSEIAALHTSLHAARISPFHEIIERAKAKGELPKDFDGSGMIARILGPMFYRRWFSRERIDEKFVKSLIGRALGAK